MIPTVLIALLAATQQAPIVGGSNTAPTIQDHGPTMPPDPPPGAPPCWPWCGN
jgi:hypothetical protein